MRKKGLIGSLAVAFVALISASLGMTVFAAEGETAVSAFESKWVLDGAEMSTAYSKDNARFTQTENLREEIANLIKKTPAPVEGNIPLIETDKKLYERVAEQIRKPFGHPLQPALDQFISVLRRTNGEEVSLEKFKEEFIAEWTKSDVFAQQEMNYKLFQRNNFRNWDEAMQAFRSVAEKATAEPINEGNIDEIFRSSLGVQRKLGGKPENLLLMMTNFRDGMLALTKDKIQFDSEEATYFSFSFTDIGTGVAPTSDGAPGGSSSGYLLEDYPMIAQHWEILSDFVKRASESGIHSFVSFRKRAIQPEKVGSFDVFHYSIEVTGTMESIRKLVAILDQAFHENRVYVVRSIFLYQDDDGARTLLTPDEIVPIVLPGMTTPQMGNSPMTPGRRRRGMPQNYMPEGQMSAAEQAAQAAALRKQQEEEEKNLPYNLRSGYGETLIGKSGLCRAIIDVEYIMESGNGI